MPNLARTDIVDILHELYIKDNQLSDMIMRENPTLALITKNPKSSGRYRKVPVNYVRPQGRSRTFANAQGGKTGSKWEAFEVPSVNNFGVAGIEGDALDDNDSDENSLIDLVRFEMDHVIENISDDLGQSIFRNTGGARGVIATGGISSATVTLEDPEDIIHFEIGQNIVFSDDDGSASAHALRSGGDALTISAVDRNLGTITFDANVATLADVVVGDYMFVEGDFKNSLAGFDSWVPASAPGGSDSFFGVNRSVDTRLSGIRFSATGLPIEEAWQNAAAMARRFKSKIDTAICNPVRWNELSLALGNKREYTTLQGQGEAAHIGFRALMLSTPVGQIPIVEDPNCPVDVGWMTDLKSWAIDHTGDQLVRLITEDGNQMQREADSDAYEFRVKSRHRMYCLDPSKTVRVTF